MPQLKPIVPSRLCGRGPRSARTFLGLARCRRPRQQRHLAHEARRVIGDEERRRLGDGIQQRAHPIQLLGREVLQHVMQDQLLGAGMADADADAPIVVGEKRVDRAQPVMAGGAAAALHPQLSLLEVELVVDDGDLAGIELEEARRRAHRLTAVVHEGLRLQQHDLAPGDRPFRELALEARPEGAERMAADDRVHRHEADIVPRTLVAGSGIAEPDDEAHQLGDAAGVAEGAAAGAAAAAAACSSRTTVGAAIEAMVKSRSIVTRVPGGSSTLLIWTLSPISMPSRSTVMCSGMQSARQTRSISWRTTLRMPPRFSPGAFSLLMKCTGTATVTRVCGPTRMKSTWSGASLTG